jgi:exodeoxyribonuclease VII large subunit
LLYPVPVQGEGAAGRIAAALGELNRRNRTLRLDLIIVGRGGGSLEDLWAFNEEAVARAIFDSDIPVISAVGHEVDTTIADLVADARASTPTRAGVAAVPDAREVLEQLAAFEKDLRNTANWLLQHGAEKLKTACASGVFKTPAMLVNARAQRLDELSPRLTGCVRQLLARAAAAIENCMQKVRRIEPHRLLAERLVGLDRLRGRLAAAATAALTSCQMALSALQNRLAALDPKSVLNRGYSITTDKKTGTVLRKTSDVALGDCIVTELADRNFIESKVQKA